MLPCTCLVPLESRTTIPHLPRTGVMDDGNHSVDAGKATWVFCKISMYCELLYHSLPVCQAGLELGEIRFTCFLSAGVKVCTPRLQWRLRKECWLVFHQIGTRYSDLGTSNQSQLGKCLHQTSLQASLWSRRFFLIRLINNMGRPYPLRGWSSR